MQAARLALAAAALCATASAAIAPTAAQAPSTTSVAPDTITRDTLDSAHGIVFPATVAQGTLVIGKVPPGAIVRYGARTLTPTPYGSVVFGVGRDATAAVLLSVESAPGRLDTIRIAITARDWPIERIDGVPPKTINPPPDIAARIAREQAQVSAARQRDDDRADFAQAFIWPLRGRVSGRFGNARVYTATDGTVETGAGHSGMDIAAPAGTPVKAPAAGIVTFAAPDLYLTGGTLVLDHGHGVSSNFLHLSRIDVKLGDRIAQGQVIAAVGATGRATGPHLHWGMNWFDVRVDPRLVLERTGNGDSGLGTR
ncbi:MAG: M23 family metallopeptidase [Luteimonas sp.]